MTRPDPERLLADWLESPPGTPPPEGLDRETVETVLALQPERAPSPRLDLDAIVAEVRAGPFHAPETGAPAEAEPDEGLPEEDDPTETGGPADRVAGDPPAGAGGLRLLRGRDGPSSRRLPLRWLAPTGTLLAAALALLAVRLQHDAPPSTGPGAGPRPAASPEPRWSRPSVPPPEALRPTPSTPAEPAAPERKPAGPPGAARPRPAAPPAPSAPAAGRSDAATEPPPAARRSIAVAPLAERSRAEPAQEARRRRDVAEAPPPQAAASAEPPPGDEVAREVWTPRNRTVPGAIASAGGGRAKRDATPVEFEAASGAKGEMATDELARLREAARRSDHDPDWYLAELDEEAIRGVRRTLDRAAADLRTEDRASAIQVYASRIDDPDLRIALDFAGRAAALALEAGQPSLALDLARRGLARGAGRNPLVERLHYLEGEALLALGDPDGARAAWQAAIAAREPG